jgi:hypothetical protein
MGKEFCKKAPSSSSFQLSNHHKARLDTKEELCSGTDKQKHKEFEIFGRRAGVRKKKGTIQQQSPFKHAKLNKRASIIIRHPPTGNDDGCRTMTGDGGILAKVIRHDLDNAPPRSK